MLTIRTKPLAKAMFTAAAFIKRGAVVLSCTAPSLTDDTWEIVLTWPEEGQQ